MMALGLYVEAVKKHEEESPGFLVELDKKLGGIMRKCPDCGSPMLCFAARWGQGCVEYICPVHGAVILDMEVCI